MKTEKRWLGFLLIVYLLLLLLPAGSSPLIESTEARYGEIAREMLASGNLIEPHLNGIKHFHKPPLAYWMVAAGMRIFGQNDFGARIGGILAAVMAVIFLYRMAMLVLEEEAKALYATLIFATSWLFLGVVHLVSTEIYLTCFVLLAQYYLFRQLYGQRTRRNAVLYGLFLGLGFLTKGPIVLLFTLLPYLTAKIFDARHRRVFSVAEAGLGCATFALVALPWYLLVIAKNPGLLHYFLKVQTVDRVVTDRFHRYQPPWYFVAVFAATFLPYLLFFIKGLGEHQIMPQRLKVLLLYIAVPFLVFSLAKGKHATYIVPLYGVVALWTAEIYGRLAMPRLRVATLLQLGVLSIAPAIAALVVRPLTPGWQILAAATCVPLGGLTWLAFRDRRRQRFLFWTAMSLLVAGCFAYALFGQITHDRRGYEHLVQRLNGLDPDRRLPVMVYRKSLPSVSFYRRQLAVMAEGDRRETDFETSAAYRDFYLTADADISDFLRRYRHLFIVGKAKDLPQLMSAEGLACDLIFRHRLRNAYLCHKELSSADSKAMTGTVPP